jgi:hypothetical protein
MTALQEEPSAHAPWTRAMFGWVLMLMIPFQSSVPLPGDRAARAWSGCGDRRGVSVSGHVYDVDTGLITTVVPAEPMPAGARMSTQDRNGPPGRTPDV